jgi:hypothetical protein
MKHAQPARLDHGRPARPHAAPLEGGFTLHDEGPHRHPSSPPQKPRDAPAATPSVRPVAHRVRAASRNQFPEDTLGVSLMPSVSAPTRTGTLDNFVWWHRLRRHKVERSDNFCRPGGPTGCCSSPSTAGHAISSGTGRSCRHVLREGFEPTRMMLASTIKTCRDNGCPASVWSTHTRGPRSSAHRRSGSLNAE